ncbi:hypothetical protein FIV34_00420 [Luteibacter pinisoli]|uniref:DUF4279 domain-containing protein n=1 Tax=Luteibacter pinisoli TaxID=2589080 RepID=A0A4Y5YY44_9GAMM|nr:hypothetical protein [Luteibacter pinisoli]QDE37767.1 hypothetical protein FIV34_00420 [Luteibacter pinisoli]
MKSTRESSADEYSCVLRIDVGDADPSALDTVLGIPGEHMHIQRPARGSRAAVEYRRWQYPTYADGSDDVWMALEDALATHAAGLLPAHVELSRYGAEGKAVWWCGSFHENPPSLVYLDPALIRQLATIGVPLYIDNYFRTSESEHAAEPPSDGADSEPLAADHAYRFWIDAPRNDARGYLAQQGDPKVWHEFSRGFEAALDTWRADQTPLKGKVLVCEHVQFAFDGGPKLRPSDLTSLADLGVALAVVWTL